MNPLKCLGITITCKDNYDRESLLWATSAHLQNHNGLGNDDSAITGVFGTDYIERLDQSVTSVINHLSSLNIKFDDNKITLHIKKDGDIYLCDDDLKSIIKKEVMRVERLHNRPVSLDSRCTIKILNH